MSGGQIVTCQSCGRLLIYGQHCLCGWHPWLNPNPTTTPPPATPATRED